MNLLQIVKVGLALWATGAWLCAGEVALVREGKPQAVILISREAETSPAARGQVATVEGAARDLQHYLREISGAEVAVSALAVEELESAVAKAKANGQTAVVLGNLATPLLKDKPEAKAALQVPDAFALVAEPGWVAIAGGNARGTEIGVHALLEQLGVRWFFPGKLGTVVPKRATLELATQQTVEKPAFAARQFQLRDAEGWVKYQRTGGRYFSGAHGIKLPKAVTFETHPQVYALVNGERRKPQLCLSNPETLRFALEAARSYFKENPNADWYGMGPEDKASFCECAGCRALDGGDEDPFSGGASMTDRYLWFLNQVLADLEGDYPNRKIAFYIYHSYMRPPVKVKPHPNIVGALAPIALCRIHGMNNPICPERSYLRPLAEAWSGLLGEVYERGYWFNLADPGMWFVQTSRLKDEIATGHALGLRGYRTECLGHWAVEGPSLYIAGRLMWDAGADTDALLRDYCEHLFGPAAGPMEAYFALIDQRLREGDHHAGSAFNVLQFFPAEVRAELDSYIAQASKLAHAEPYAARVALFAQGHGYASAFAQMLEAQYRQEWGAAHQSLQKVDHLRGELVEKGETPMLGRTSSGSYLRRFFRLPVEQGWARASQNRGLAPLSNQWLFLTDPDRVGEALGYEREAPLGGNWQKLDVSEGTWGDAGLRYYKGLAWYRQEVELPADLAAGRVFLWFGGVDESAKVWVNGKLVGNSPRSAFTPFELDATGAVRPGKNTVAVCVANLHVDELGSGGLTAPAFFYAPVKGAEAALENVRPLGETFP